MISLDIHFLLILMLILLYLITSQSKYWSSKYYNLLNNKTSH